MYIKTLFPFLFILCTGVIAYAGTRATTEPATTVAFESYEGYAVVDTFKPDEPAIFAIIQDEDKFSAAFSPRAPGAKKTLEKGWPQSRVVLAAVRRSEANWRFTVKDVIVGTKGDLTVRYTSSSTPCDHAQANSLLISLPREVAHDTVRFEENGKEVGLATEEWQDEVADARWAATKADAEMNKVYKQLMDVLGPDERRHLVATERAWIAYRDEEAEFASESTQVGSGSTRALLRANCIRSLTDERTKQLRVDLDDMSSK